MKLIETLPTTKVCSKCNETKPLEDYPFSRPGKEWRSKTCTQCTREYKAQWARNKNGHNERKKLVREVDRRQCSKCMEIKEVGEFHRDSQKNDGLSPSCKDCSKMEKAKWYQENQDKAVEYSQKWYADNTIKASISYQKRYLSDPAPFKARAQKRRALELSATIGKITAELLDARLAYYGYKCWICKTADYEHLDHVKPLSKGGAHMLANLRPACAECNLSKSNKWPFVPPERRRNV